MDFKLNHIGVLCQDQEKSLKCYLESLGCQLTSRWFNRSLLDLAFVGVGNDVTLELVGRPFLGYEEEHLARHGYSINHISFLVEDAEAAFTELTARGVEVAWSPINVIGLRQCGFRDPDGLLFEVYSHLDPAMPLAGPDLGGHRQGTDLRLDHISILTHDLRRSQRFYSDILGLRTVYEYLADDGGFIFLADPCFDAKTHPFLLEIIGPPNLEPREVEILQKHGACYDHLAFAADDARGAWQIALGRGAKNMADPVDGYGLCIAWLRDADGNDVEIMSTIPAQLVEDSLKSGQPYDGMALSGGEQ